MAQPYQPQYTPDYQQRQAQYQEQQYQQQQYQPTPEQRHQYQHNQHQQAWNYGGQEGSPGFPQPNFSNNKRPRSNAGSSSEEATQRNMAYSPGKGSQHSDYGKGSPTASLKGGKGTGLGVMAGHEGFGAPRYHHNR
jgi:hypothetical protein